MSRSKKISAYTESIQSDLNELHSTNQKLIGEIDALQYKLDKLTCETEEIRREVRTLNRTVDKLRYDLLDAIRNKRTYEIHEIVSSMFPLLAITLPALFTVLMIFLYKVTR